MKFLLSLSPWGRGEKRSGGEAKLPLHQSINPDPALPLFSNLSAPLIRSIYPSISPNCLLAIEA